MTDFRECAVCHAAAAVSHAHGGQPHDEEYDRQARDACLGLVGRQRRASFGNGGAQPHYGDPPASSLWRALQLVPAPTRWCVHPIYLATTAVVATPSLPPSLHPPPSSLLQC